MIIDRKAFRFREKVLIEKLTIKAPFSYKAIFHNEGCFLYLKGGAASINAPTQKAKFQSKEAILLNCGTYFVEWLKDQNADTCQVFALHLYPDVLKEIYRNELPALITRKGAADYFKKLVPDDTIARYIDNLDFYFENTTLVNDDLLGLKIKELILLLLQTKNAESIHQLFAELFTTKTIKIQDVIKQHLYSNLTLDNLAELAGLSVSSFKREFHKIYDDSPIHHINELRLAKSKDFLRLTNKTVGEIAYELGYSDPGYFTKLFKKKFKTTPKEFRNQV